MQSFRQFWKEKKDLRIYYNMDFLLLEPISQQSGFCERKFKNSPFEGIFFFLE
jgi:hypothetical protein